MGSRTTLITSLVFAIAAPALYAEATCAADEVKIMGDFGSARFSVEVADDDAERSKGLMHVKSMPSSAGMLFVFDPPRPVAFWMKNTLIPLDMIFTDRQGRIQHIHANAIPHDETPIPGGQGIYTVLEINGGLAERFGIGVGDALQHPVFAGGPAALPCAE